MGRFARAGVRQTAGLAAAVLGSCSLFAPGAPVLVQVPEPPPHWRQAFPDLCFVVQYVDSRGSAVEVLADAGGSALVECTRKQNSPVLAWPCGRAGFPAPGELRPAGGFYPLSLGEGERAGSLFARWEDGCAALAVQRVRDAGMDTGQFNVARLAACMREAADPWSWECAAIAGAIAGGGFTSFDLDRLPCRDATFCAGPGVWFLESPFSIPSTAGADGMLALPGVPLGTHMLYSLQGTRRMVWIGESEVIVGPETRGTPAFPRNRRLSEAGPGPPR